MKDFKQELLIMHDRLIKGESFAFSKYADGEWAAMLNLPLDNREFKNENSFETSRKELIESFRFKHPNYFVGISCECCQGENHFRMKEFSTQPIENLTYANLFVNSNYPIYKQLFLPEYEKRDVHLVCNKLSKIENLPFVPEETYFVGYNAWVEDHDLIKKIQDKNLSDKLFLFCCGPFGNLLAHQLFSSNQKNIYLDIGSTLNPWLQSEGFKRDYYSNGFYAGRKCFWRE